jgi:capsular exopolysaccharide synthesis family protein
MTYLDFFKFRVDPFAAVYERSRYFPTAASTQVLKSLTDVISQRRGVMLLTGRIGVGKTFAQNQLCSALPPEWLALHILNSPQSGDDLLQQVASHVGLPHGPGDLTDLRARIGKQFARMNERDRRVVLFFDDAESLSPDVIRHIRWLAEMEVFERKLVQIVLVARPGFRNKFTQLIWAPIRHRVALSCELNPMNPNEVAGYIDHRIRCAADLGCVVEFSAEAKADIAQASAGLPRMVNAITRDCLLRGSEVKIQYMDRDIVAHVLAEMKADFTPQGFGPAPARAMPGKPDEPAEKPEVPATSESPEQATLTKATQEFLDEQVSSAERLEESFAASGEQAWPMDEASAAQEEVDILGTISEMADEEPQTRADADLGMAPKTGTPPETGAAPKTDPAQKSPSVEETLERQRKSRANKPREIHLASEEYRSLRTSLLSACHGRFCFMVTSAHPKEGKTVTCMNLGIMMTERQGKRTVLIDANLRNHALTDQMNAQEGPGLAEFLRDQAKLDEILQPTDYENLFLIPAGNLADVEVGELLNRPELPNLLATLKQDYDHVIVDAPSVHRTTDATVIGAAAGNALMVVRMYGTSRDAVHMAIRQLKATKVNVSGVVLTHRKFFIPNALYRHL